MADCAASSATNITKHGSDMCQVFYARFASARAKMHGYAQATTSSGAVSVARASPRANAKISLVLTCRVPPSSRSCH